MRPKILPLREVTFAIPTLCQWHLDGWGPEYNLNTLDDAKPWVLAGATEKMLPICFVAIEQGSPLGMISFEPEDGLNTHESPWLCSLYVAKPHRHCGIGKALISHVIQHAKNMGFDRLYLLTLKESATHWYLKLGWEILRTDSINGSPCTVMTLGL